MRALTRTKLMATAVFIVIAAFFGATAGPAAAAPYSSEVTLQVGVSTNVPLPGQNILIYVHDAATGQTLLVYLNINGSSVLLGALYADSKGIAYGYLKLPENVGGSGYISVAPGSSSSTATPTPTPKAGSTSSTAKATPTPTPAAAKVVSVPVTVGGTTTALTSYTKVASAVTSGVDATSVTPTPAATPALDESALSYTSPNQQNASDAGFKTGYTDAMVAVVAVIALLLLGAGGAAQLYVARKR